MKTIERFLLCLALGIAMPVTLTACRSAETEPEPTAGTETDTAAEGIDHQSGADPFYSRKVQEGLAALIYWFCM